MDKLLPHIDSPADLRNLTLPQLEQLADEIREALTTIVRDRPAHFASNLGVVELCLALHTTFDFSRDRLIWDTGHQIYPHKLVTGRYHEFGTIRTKGGLMGYPNPNESPYDLFMTGHAGCSVSTVMGLKAGDQQLGQGERHAVAVIGDGAFPSGIVFEALNNAAGLKQKLVIILNDNKMSICPRVGGLAQYLDRLRVNPLYEGLKSEVHKLLERMPTFIGEPTEKFLWQLKESIKAGVHGGMLFEDLGVRYIGPVDGHDIASLRRYLELVKDVDGPVLLHVFTEKGHGFQPAEEDPVFFHTPSPFQQCADGKLEIKKSSARSYTHVASDAIFTAMEKNPRVSVLTAAMCQGNNLGKVRDKFPERFFDTGICEEHAVAFAAGMAKAGCRPIVDIYSTFLQRSYDQIFQEVSLQKLPVTFLLDRAGLTGPDGPTHHGSYDIGYMRVFPHLVIMAPGDQRDLEEMLDFSLMHDAPCSIRYPKCNAEQIDRAFAPIEVGKSEVLEWGQDGCIVAFGTLVHDALKASARLREEGLDVGVINARFAKPLDTETILRAIDECGFVVTVEEGALPGGFGSAVLEAACDAGLDTRRLKRLGLPDRFVEHGERGELLADLGLDAAGIAKTCRAMAEAAEQLELRSHSNLKSEI